MPELRIDDVYRHFHDGSRAGGNRPPVRAVDGVSLDVDAGRTLGLVGESGCGKSTLARLIVGLDRPTRGSIRFRDELVNSPKRARYRTRRRLIQMIFQDPFASLSPRRRVRDTLAEPILNFALHPASLERRLDELLESVGLPFSAKDRYPHEFSGGQRQRICIARALAAEPALIVADEPVSALDVSVQAQIVNLLAELQARLGITLVFVSHDMAVVEHVSDRVAVMYLGQVVEHGDARDIFAHPAHPYTRALLGATPLPDPELGPIEVTAQGEIPSPRTPPPGCRFHTRCPHAVPRCTEDVPAAVTLSPAHRATCHFAAELLG